MLFREMIRNPTFLRVALTRGELEWQIACHGTSCRNYYAMCVNYHLVIDSRFSEVNFLGMRAGPRQVGNLNSIVNQSSCILFPGRDLVYVTIRKSNLNASHISILRGNVTILKDGVRGRDMAHFFRGVNFP